MCQQSARMRSPRSRRDDASWNAGFWAMGKFGRGPGNRRPIFTPPALPLLSKVPRRRRDRNRRGAGTRVTSWRARGPALHRWSLGHPRAGAEGLGMRGLRGHLRFARQPGCPSPRLTRACRAHSMSGRHIKPTPASEICGFPDRRGKAGGAFPAFMRMRCCGSEVTVTESAGTHPAAGDAQSEKASISRSSPWMINPVTPPLLRSRIGRRVGYLVKYQFSGFIRPNALAA